MVENGEISIRGLKENPYIMNEIIFDVNTKYFEDNGGYDFAKEFYEKAYEYAKQKIGEEYIVSAVMHADEINQAVSEDLGKEVYHYHLHVVSIPIVRKEILWSKRCKDENLRGTVKEVINQVSDSKKWKSEKTFDETGKSYMKKSYSVLQDEFCDYMKSSGYQDIERGIKGSKSKHQSNEEFKMNKDKERIVEIKKERAKEEKALAVIKEKKVKVNDVLNIKVRQSKFNKDESIIPTKDYDNVQNLALKYITSKSNEKKLLTDNKQLKHKVIEQKCEINELKSLDYKMKWAKSESENKELKKEIGLFKKFLEKFDLVKRFEQFKRIMKGDIAR